MKGHVGGQRVFLLHVKVVHSVLRCVVLAGIVNQRPHQLIGSSCDVPHDRLCHVANLGRVHLHRHTYVRVDSCRVAYNFYGGNLWHNLIRDTLGTNYSFLKLCAFHIHKNLNMFAVVHLYRHGFSVNHREA